ncbi:MAG TPA: DUF4391 domain-containing protein [Thermoanaerobaculia bacterium]|nr:DUF4391 domain-containing protein [Thermoanaerobaculia bacterium]
MTAADLIAALDLPVEARVDRRVPKTLLVEHGAPTAADRRRIQDGIEEVRWLAVLKPTTIGVPPFRAEDREYLEIAVLSAELRGGAKAGRLAELIHRAIPYPVFLAVTGPRGVVALSLAHKRWSKGEEGATVLDGELVSVELPPGKTDDIGKAFCEALRLARQPRSDLRALYQGWMAAMVAFQAAGVTGAFAVPASTEEAAGRQEAVREHARLSAEIARLRAVAAKERQMARRVDLNLEVQRLEKDLSLAKERL